MPRLFGWILAGGVLLGSASTANAQFSLSVRNPITGGGFSLGVPAVGYGYYGGGYGSPYMGLGGLGYSSYGYGGLPLTGTTYSSGYTGYVAPANGYFRTGTFATYPYVAGSPYGYGGLGIYGGAAYPYMPYRYGWYGARRWGW